MAILRPSRRISALFLATTLLLLVPACGGDDEPAGPDENDEVVGPDGGSLTFEGGEVRLTFPAGAVDSDLRVTVSPASGPANTLLVPGTSYDFGPDGTVFGTPVTLTLTYDPSQLPSGVLESELGVYRVEGGGWQAVAGSSVSAGANTVSAPLQAFSIYGAAALAVASVTVEPDPAVVDVGGTLQLQATSESSGGTELPEREVTWASSDESVAAVDETGLVTGVAEGEVTVTATAEGVEGTAEVTVAVVVTEVTVEPAVAEVAVGGSVQLTATPRGSDGSALERDVTWSSSDESVATVDSDGLVAAVAEGEATITAESEGVEGTATVTVTNPVASVEVTADVQGIVAGGSTTLDVVVRDGAGGVLDDREVAWSTSDESVATVDGNGEVTAVAPGVVTLTATSEGIEGTVDLTVTIDWNEFAGTWSGSWTNTTFASSDAIDATVTIDVATLTATMIIDVDGPVFGMQDPLPMTIVGTLTPTTMQVDYNAPLHGRIVFDLAPGDFDLESESVPAGGIDAWTYTGTNTTTTHTGAFTIQFTGGGSAQGVVEVTKQE